ncbi:hypothetical protein KXW10_006686, partial [Aspergillus fumigatus]
MSNELKLDDCEYLCNAQVILQTLRRFLVFETGEEEQREIEQEKAQGEKAQGEKAQGAKAQ